MVTFEHGLDSQPFSMNMGAQIGVTYQVNDFSDWDNVRVSSARISGANCEVEFKDKSGATRCTKKEGSYGGSYFTGPCGNDVVTQYVARIGSKLFLLIHVMGFKGFNIDLILIFNFFTRLNLLVLQIHKHHDYYNH